jgi:general stress protein YciG
MDRERQREIAAEGGRAAHQSGNAHRFNSEEARKAGAKGGTSAHQRGTAHQFTSEEARAAGRIGGRRGARTNEFNQRTPTNHGYGQFDLEE